MGWLEGMLGGFVEGKNRREDQNRRDQELASQREQNLYTTLLHSDNPEAQSYGLSGLLASAQPGKRKSGLAGWMGEMEQSPIHQQIRQFLATPQTREITENVDSGLVKPPETQGFQAFPGTSGYPTIPGGQPNPTEIPEVPPDQSAAAMPPGSAVTGTAGGTAATPPPPPQTQMGVQGWQPTMPPPEPLMIQRKRTETGPVRIYLSPLDKFTEQAQGKEVGDIRGLAVGMREAGFSEPEIHEGLKQHLQRKMGVGAAGTMQAVKGTLPDGSPAFGIMDRRPASPTFGKFLSADTGEVLHGFLPQTTTASFSLGHDAESVAGELYGKRASALMTDPAKMAHINAVVLQRKNQLTIKDAMGFANTMLPNATLEQKMDLAERLKNGTAAPVSGAVDSGGAAPTNPAVTATPAGTPGSPAAATPPPTTGGPAHLGVSLPPKLSEATKETGKPLPGPMVRALSQSQSIQDTIDQAIKALEPFKNDNTIEGTMTLAAKYRSGVYDPVGGTASQLANLAALQSSGQSSLGGGRQSVRIYIDKLQHVPILPTARQVAFSQGTGLTLGIGAGAQKTHDFSQMFGKEGSTWDTPQQMYQKLIAAKAVNQHFLDDMKAGGYALPGVGATESPGAVSTPQSYQDAAGVWHIRQ